MKECIICKNKIRIGFLKCNDGPICKSCSEYIYDKIKIKTSDAVYLAKIIEDNKEKSKTFECTASLGRLYIDAIHNLYCISQKGKRAPERFSDIFSIEETKEVGLYCTNVRNVGTNYNNVVCDIKLTVNTVQGYYSEYTVCENKQCPFERKDGKLVCSEPNDFSVFRQMFNQMIENTALGLLKKLEAIQKMQAAISALSSSVEWAKGIMMIDANQNYNKELLKNQRNMMVKLFHPDRNGEYADDHYASMINEAYTILLEEGNI